MDYPTQLKRFLNRRVCIDLWGRNTLWGTLVAVSYDHLRLKNTVIVGELEGHGWFEQMQYGQDGDVGGPRNAETIVRIEVVMHISYADDDLPEPISEADASGADGDSELPSDNRILAEPVELTEKLADLQGSQLAEDPDASEQEVDLTVRADRLEIELGVGLLSIAMPSRGGDLLDRIAQVRKQVAAEMGVILPRARVRDCFQLDTSAYRIRVNGRAVASGQLSLDRLLAVNLNEYADQIEGTDAIEPLQAAPAKWIEPKCREHVESIGGRIIEPACVLASHLFHCVRENLHDLLGYQDVLHLLESLKASCPEAVAEIIPNQVPVSQLHRLLKSLLEERVSILHLMRIIESAAYHRSMTSSQSKLLRKVREDIGTQICIPFTDDAGKVRVRMMDESTENTILEMVSNKLELSTHECLAKLESSLPRNGGDYAILVRNSQIRRLVFKELARRGHSVSVISKNELPRGSVLVMH